MIDTSSERQGVEVPESIRREMKREEWSEGNLAKEFQFPYQM